MSIPIANLTEADYMIMAYVSKYSSVTRENVVEHFRGKLVSVSYRIDLLSRSTPKYGSKDEKAIEAFSRYIDNNSGALSITEFGAAALQEHNFRERAHKRELWLRTAWIPIGVSLATNLLLHGIPRLLPLVLEWIANIRG